MTTMQATVSRYDDTTRSGAVLTDTGVELPFTADALATTPVRFLRPGQRVRLDTTGTGPALTITALHFITLPSPHPWAGTAGPRLRGWPGGGNARGRHQWGAGLFLGVGPDRVKPIGSGGEGQRAAAF